MEARILRSLRDTASSSVSRVTVFVNEYEPGSIYFVLVYGRERSGALCAGEVQSMFEAV